MKQLTNSEFQTLVEQAPFALVKYGAPWCSGCTAIEPVVAQVAASSTVPCYAVDIDAEPELKTQARIKSIPAIILYRDGRMVDFIFGQTTAAQLEQKLTLLTAV